MRILINIVYIFLLIGYIPALLIKGKLHRGYKQRCGFLPKDLVHCIKGSKNIWIHAVSVGEVMAIVDLVGDLKNKYSDYNIICSTVTQTGYALALNRLEANALVVYSPLDFSWIVKKFIKVINPKIYICTETEIWPNLYLSLKKSHVPIIQINGRISDKTFDGYKKIKGITKRSLKCVSKFCMQSQKDADRILELGAIPKNVEVIGNLKFDNLPNKIDISRERIGYSDQDIILLAGSTHPGEDEILLKVYQKLKVKCQDLQLIICPRHPERSMDIAQLCEQEGLKNIQYSNIERTKKTKDSIVIVDTVGHLREMYSLASIVFIGKTFKVGGAQNMIEPAFFGKPIILGPSVYNFTDVVKIFKEEKAIVQVDTQDELFEELSDLLGNKVRCESLGLAAHRVVQKYQGATTKTLLAIEELINK